MKLPPGLKGRPVLGNMPGYARDPLGFLTLCSREYGDVVRLRFPGPPVYLLTPTTSSRCWITLRPRVGIRMKLSKGRTARHRESVERSER